MDDHAHQSIHVAIKTRFNILHPSENHPNPCNSVGIASDTASAMLPLPSRFPFGPESKDHRLGPLTNVVDHLQTMSSIRQDVKVGI
jgi:hypothetical protein